MKNNILITGGAGFIGSNTARYFIKKGWQVSILDNLSRKGANANLDNLKKNYNFKNLINVNCGISKKFLSSQFQNEKKKKINLFYVGRLALKQKPLDLIIKSLANIRSFNKFFIAGSGPDKKNLLKLIKIKKSQQYSNIIVKKICQKKLLSV